MSGLILDHVVIAVRDLDEATRDYEALFGRRASWRGEHPPFGTTNTLFRIENTYVELLAPGAGKRKGKRWSDDLARRLDADGEGVYALALGTRDIKSTVTELRDNGLEVADPADGDGVDLASRARRAWRNALVSPKWANGARVFVIEHRSPPDALPLAPVAADGACVRRMDHAVVLSADMEASRRFWYESLGLRLALDRTFPDRNTRIMFFRLADITIEISGGAVQAEEGIGKPDRYWGLAWGVDDIRATCERLRAVGIDVSGPRPGIKPGTLVATAKGPRTHGVATLLIEHTPESFRPEARAPQGTAYDNAPQHRAFMATGLDRVTLITSDLDESWPKWARTLELSPREVFLSDQDQTRIARLPGGNATIELAQPLSADAALGRIMAAHGPGMASISVAVDDIDAAVIDLRSKGIAVSDVARRRGGERIATVDPAAANGVTIELIQR